MGTGLRKSMNDVGQRVAGNPSKQAEERERGLGGGNECGGGRAQAAMSLLCWGLGSGAVVLLAHRLGKRDELQVPWSRFFWWVEVAAPADVLMALCRYLVLGVGYWLLLSTLVCVIAAITRLPSALRAVERMAFPVIRQQAQRFAAVSFSVVSLVGTAGNAMGVSVFSGDRGSELQEETVYGHVPSSLVPDINTWIFPHIGDPLLAVHEKTETAGKLLEQEDLLPNILLFSPPSKVFFPERKNEEGNFVEVFSLPDMHTIADVSYTYSHVVMSGEHMWGVAMKYFQDLVGSSPTFREATDYWREVQEINRSQLRSKDPDLVYVGEILYLPIPNACRVLSEEGKNSCL